MKRLLLFIVLGTLVCSCIENRKVLMVQKNDVNKKNMIRDSVLRRYELDSFVYKLQPNDLLYVKWESLTAKEYDFFTSQTQQMNLVQGNPLLIGELVDPGGKVPFPFIGKVQVEGLTVFQAQDTLQKIANQYLESPNVKVRLINYRMTLLGEVAKEGTVTFTNNRVSMLEAIGLAGGLGEYSDRKNVKLVRQIGSKTEVAYINLLDENFFRSPYYYVHQNDIIIVPPLRQRPYRKYFGQNLALFISSLSLLLLVINTTK